MTALVQTRQLGKEFGKDEARVRAVIGAPLPGARIVLAWYRGAHGNVLRSAPVLTIEQHMFCKGAENGSAMQYLSAHHDNYFLAY